MKFQDLVNKAREVARETDVSNVDFLAVQINITEPDGGVFYVEVKDHRVSVEPYDYYDRNCAITISNEDFLRFLDGGMNAEKAYEEGVIKVDGDLGKAAWFCDLINKTKSAPEA